jgi:hypothetical protein
LRAPPHAAFDAAAVTPASGGAVSAAAAVSETATSALAASGRGAGVAGFTITDAEVGPNFRQI